MNTDAAEFKGGSVHIWLRRSGWDLTWDLTYSRYTGLFFCKLQNYFYAHSLLISNSTTHNFLGFLRAYSFGLDFVFKFPSLGFGALILCLTWLPIWTWPHSLSSWLSCLGKTQVSTSGIRWHRQRSSVYSEKIRGHKHKHLSVSGR